MKKLPVWLANLTQNTPLMASRLSERPLDGSGLMSDLPAEFNAWAAIEGLEYRTSCTDDPEVAFSHWEDELEKRKLYEK